MLKVAPYPKASIQLSPKEKLGQLFMPAAFINDSEEEIQKLEKLIGEQCIGSLCFFHSRASAATNFEGAKTIVHNANSLDALKKLIQRYQKAARHPLLIAIDAEWGLAMRVENTPQYPYAITLGAIDGDQNHLIYEVAKNIAKDCRAACIHWNLAPCADINNNPLNPVIGYRSFGEDKVNVTEKALAFVQGTQSEGVLTSIKHFPGHGDTATDSHLALPLIGKSKSELLSNELHPFQELIREGVDSVMVGHLSVPALSTGKTTSSSLSKEIITGLLRTQMGYSGVIISDALNMHAVSKNYPVKGELEWLAFDAGNDVLCFAEHISDGIETILAKASEEQIENSFQRVWKLKEKVQDSGLFEDGETKISTGKPNFAPSSNVMGFDALLKKIAKESLILLTGSIDDIAAFKKTDYHTLSLPELIDNHFLNNINQNKNFNSKVSTEDFRIDGNNILIALFPPHVKPTDSFGLSEQELTFTNKLIRTKNVVLYLFGNPYVLNLIDYKKAKAVIIVSQNFVSFQEVAAHHFLGKLKAKAKLPVTIKS